MDLNLELRVERPADFMDKSSFDDKERYGKVGPFELHKSYNHEACYYGNF